MNIDTGEIARLSPAQAALREKLIAGMQQLPAHLSPFAEEYMEENPGKPVDLQQKSALSNYAEVQREKRAANPGSFGRCKNRPQ